MTNLTAITGFDWVAGNARKNDQHGVSMAEAEQVFFNSPLLVLEDVAHSQAEPRFHALGLTDVGRLLAHYLHIAADRRLDSGDFCPRYAS